MADIPYIQQAQEVKITGQDSAGTTVNYVTADANGNLAVKETSAGPVTAGTVAANSSLMGGQFNTVLPTLTNTQQAAIQLDSSGHIFTTLSSEAADGSAVPSKLIAIGGETPTATLEPIAVDASGNILASSKIALTASSPTFFTVGVASAQAVAANANRKGLVLTNTSNKIISIGLGATAVANSGIVLTANGVWVMDEFTFTTAAVNTIASGASANLAIQEFTT